MLISIMPSEICKLTDFTLYSQNPETMLCCGITAETENEAVFEKISEIPSGQEQRCLPPDYGKRLTLEQIEQGLEDYTAPQRTIADMKAALEILGVSVDG